MFRWTCLAVAVGFLGALLWLLNDLRLELRESSERLREATQTVNEHLPTIMEKSRATTDTLSQHLPEIVEKSRKTTDTLAELAADISQLKELAGISGTNPRDKNLVAYADSVLDYLETSSGTIGLRKSLGNGLKDQLPAKEWAVGARKEALYLTVVAKSKAELLNRLGKNRFGSAWQIKLEGKEPQPLIDWLKANHPASKES